MFGSDLVLHLVLAALPLTAAASPQAQQLVRREGPPGTVTVNTPTDFSIVFGRQRLAPNTIACPPTAFITSICGKQSRRTTGNFARIFGLGEVSVKCSDGSVSDPFSIGDGEHCLIQPTGFTQIGIGHGSFVDRIRDINLPDGFNPRNFIGNLGGDINNVVAPVPGMKLQSLTISYGGFVGDPAHLVTFSFRVNPCTTANCAECDFAGVCARCNDGLTLQPDKSCAAGTAPDPIDGCPLDTFVLNGLCVPSCPPTMALSGNTCVETCPAGSLEITSLEGRRNCNLIPPAPAPGTDTCPATPGLRKRERLSLFARQAADLPLDRFTFDPTCSADNQASLSKGFGEAVATLRQMKLDLDGTLAAAAAGDGTLPANSNMAIAFGPMNTNQARKIRNCMGRILENMEDINIQMKVRSCEFSGGAFGGALAAALIGERPSLHPQLMFSRGFFRCDQRRGLNDWRFALPKTAIIHELSHSFCLTDDKDTTGAVTYYASKTDWKAFLTRSAANNFADSRQNADAYRIWAHAVTKHGIFPLFGDDPEVKDELRRM
ncbi:hypothetical protein HK102_006652 [Quaeritorhiza haematococci]|nr:hypothetical protein HK102_006652 [Quaeritorhiza haematococci]